MLEPAWVPSRNTPALGRTIVELDRTVSVPLFKTSNERVVATLVLVTSRRSAVTVPPFNSNRPWPVLPMFNCPVPEPFATVNAPPETCTRLFVATPSELMNRLGAWTAPPDTSRRLLEPNEHTIRVPVLVQHEPPPVTVTTLLLAPAPEPMMPDVLETVPPASMSIWFDKPRPPTVNGPSINHAELEPEMRARLALERKFTPMMPVSEAPLPPLVMNN